MLALLLLSGCQQGSSKADSTAREDSMKAFFERMRRWEVLHGGMSRTESDK